LTEPVPIFRTKKIAELKELWRFLVPEFNPGITKNNEFQKNWSEIFEDFPAAKRIPNSKHPIRIKLLFFCPSITIRTS